MSSDVGPSVEPALAHSESKGLCDRETERSPRDQYNQRENISATRLKQEHHPRSASEHDRAMSVECATTSDTESTYTKMKHSQLPQSRVEHS